MRNPFNRPKRRWLFENQRGKIRLRMGSVAKGQDVDLIVHIEAVERLSTKTLAKFKYPDWLLIQQLVGDLNEFVKGFMTK